MRPLPLYQLKAALRARRDTFMLEALVYEQSLAEIEFFEKRNAQLENENAELQAESKKRLMDQINKLPTADRKERKKEDERRGHWVYTNDGNLKSKRVE